MFIFSSNIKVLSQFLEIFKINLSEISKVGYEHDFWVGDEYETPKAIEKFWYEFFFNTKFGFGSSFGFERVNVKYFLLHDVFCVDVKFFSIFFAKTWRKLEGTTWRSFCQSNFQISNRWSPTAGSVGFKRVSFFSPI